MIIHVTQEHIDKGERGSCLCCPVALSIEEAGFYAVEAYETIIIVGRSHERKQVHPPPSVGNFIRRFDNHKPVKPFAFEVDL